MSEERKRIDAEGNTNKEILDAASSEGADEEEEEDEGECRLEAGECNENLYAGECNENVYGILGERIQTLKQIMDALADPCTQIVGLQFSDENFMKITSTLLVRIIRRVERDNMFDVILKATVINKPNIKKIQDEIAGDLGLKLDEKSKSKRSSLLHDNIKTRQKILVILCELYNGIDLGEVGIPYGADQSDCKILLTSTSENVLLSQFHSLSLGAYIIDIQ